MSSRDDIYGYLEANWTTTPIFALDDYMSLDDLPASALEDIILLVDFPSASENLATIAVHLTNGWREQGLVQLGFAVPLGGDNSIARAHGEALRTLMRGRRIGATVVEAVDSFSSVGNVDGKWVMFIAFARYYRDYFQ